MKAWRWRRSVGSNSSARQSAQVAVSGGTPVLTRPGRLARMAKPAASCSGGRLVTSTCSMRASAGASVRRRRSNSASASAAPCTSMATPWASLRTQPARPRLHARPCTKGRKPTPCTRPRTRRARRWLSVGAAASMVRGCRGRAARRRGPRAQGGCSRASGALAAPPWCAAAGARRCWRAAVAPRAIQSSQASMPAPWVAESWMTSMPGLTRRA